MKKLFLVLAVIALLGVGGIAQALPSYETGFESMTPGTIAGQEGWLDKEATYSE